MEFQVGGIEIPVLMLQIMPVSIEIKIKRTAARHQGNNPGIR